MNRDHVLACGCYADAIPPAWDHFRWMRYPNAGLFHEDDANEILERGWLTVNGNRASHVFRDNPKCPHFLIWDYDQPFDMPAGYSTRVAA